MEKELVAISVWKRYETYDLEIAPSLASAFHLFRHQDLSIKITLPKRPKQQNWRKENAPITCWRYRPRGNRDFPRSYRVHQVDATIETGITRSIRKDALGTLGFVNASLFNMREQASLNKLTHSNEELIDSASGKSFYRPGLLFRVKAARPIKKKEWNKAQSILSEGKDVPIWQLYYAEAYERLVIGDMRGYIISLAISSETIIRYLARHFLKEPVNIKYQSIVNTIPISRIISDWYKLGFDSTAWKSLKEERKAIIKIFEYRNGIMHRGEDPSIAKKRQLELGTAVKRFLKQGEKHG